MNESVSMHASRLSVLSKKPITIFNCDFKKQQINDAKSVEAMRSLGYCMDELMYVEFLEYINVQDGVKALPKDMQQKRYDTFEQARQKKINDIIENYNKLFMPKVKNEEEIELNNSNASSEQEEEALENKIEKSKIEEIQKQKVINGTTQLEKDKKNLKRLETRQQKGLYNMIQLEINKQLENQHHMKKQIRQQNREERLKNEKLFKSYKGSPQEIEEYLNADENQKEFVMHKIVRKHSAIELKDEEEFRKSYQSIFKARKSELDVKQKELDLKDFHKKTSIIRKKTMQMNFYEDLKEKKKIKFEAVAKAFEEKALKRRLDFDVKQQMLEDRKQERAKLREMAFKENKEKFDMQMEKIKKTVRKGVRIEQQRLLNYFYKKTDIEKRKDELARMKEEEMLEKERYKQQKLNGIRKQVFEAKINDLKYRDQLKERLIEHDNRIQNVLTEKGRRNLLHSQSSTILRIERYDKIKQMGRYKEYQRDNLHKRLDEKSQIIDDFKKQRKEIAHQKRELNFVHSDMKLQFKQSFDNLLKNKDINENTMVSISKNFPNRNLKFDTGYLVSPSNLRKKSTISATQGDFGSQSQKTLNEIGFSASTTAKDNKHKFGEKRGYDADNQTKGQTGKTGAINEIKINEFRGQSRNSPTKTNGNRISSGAERKSSSDLEDEGEKPEGKNKLEQDKETITSERREEADNKFSAESRAAKKLELEVNRSNFNNPSALSPMNNNQENDINKTSSPKTKTNFGNTFKHHAGSKSVTSFNYSKSKANIFNENKKTGGVFELSKRDEILKEKEILRKVDNYRIKLNDDLLAILAEEKKKEEQREKLAASEQDEEKRKKLETSHGKERALATSRIVRFNRDIDKRVSEFEADLRDNYGKKSKLSLK